jgi:DNA-binding GntR family transcriptional regulator
LSVLPIRRATAVTTLAGALREELLSGAFPPGTPLREASLTERTGAAPATVRQALAELARDGLVVHSLHRGVEVARMTSEELFDIYAARRVYETAGLMALVARRPVDVTWLSAAAERMGEAAVDGDGRAMVEADIAFHLAIVAAAGSRRLTAAAQGVLSELRLVLSVADRAIDDMPSLVADHEYLIDVFSAGAVGAAVGALEDHLVQGEALARTVASEG